MQIQTQRGVGGRLQLQSIRNFDAETKGEWLAPGHGRLSPRKKHVNHCTRGWSGVDSILHGMEI